MLQLPLPEPDALGNWTFIPRAFVSDSSLFAVQVLFEELPPTQFEAG